MSWKHIGIFDKPDSEELWTEIIDQIPDDVLLKPDIKILNVACGYGTEANVIIKRMRNLGLSDDHINNSIYVLDRTIWATNRIRILGGFNNVIRADFLTWETDMKFDIVVGNPPYKIDGDSSYYTKFIEKSGKVLSEDGLIAFVVPNRFLDPGSKSAKIIHNLFSLTTVFANLNESFPGIGTNIAGFIGSYSLASTKKTTKVIFPESSIDWDMQKALPIQATTIIGASIIDKVFNSLNQKLILSRNEIAKDYVFVDSAYIRFCHTKPKGGKKSVISRVNQTNEGIIENGRGMFLKMGSETEAHLNSWYLSKSLLGRFCVYSFANAAQVSYRNLARMPKISGINMNDSELFSFFNISTTEQEYILDVLVRKKETS